MRRGRPQTKTKIPEPAVGQVWRFFCRGSRGPCYRIDRIDGSVAVCAIGLLDPETERLIPFTESSSVITETERMVPLIEFGRRYEFMASATPPTAVQEDPFTRLEAEVRRLERVVRYLAGQFYKVSMDSDHYDLDWQALRGIADGQPELALFKVPE